MATDVAITPPRAAGGLADRLSGFLAYCSTSPMLPAGILILMVLLCVGWIGPHLVDPAQAAPTSVLPDQPPSREFPLGTDDQGRNLAASIVVGMPLTLRVGFIAGAIALGVGTVLGFLAGYVGGVVDLIVRGLSDILLTVPALIVLVTIASSIKGNITVGVEAFVVASLAWMWPTRTIRSQVLTLRERAYVQIAKLSGMRTRHIIFVELIPNLLPYLAASFVTSTSAAVLASIGLEALGLGPQNEPTLGMTIYWAISFNALIRGLWWWWAVPIILLGLLFMSLFLISAGLDAIANPRAHRARR
jgi:peptide/nickel transport system permease protein